ncbi:phosphatidate cytidylyltransferase [Roseicella aquatilis]|uniref:phosphatidate cytidylyltransferase n=1 Tax=Roseicella aquatilis TaxID=2527868 RepID=UPI001F11230E|nr:phosphatidate cytidylyltransferase [Roseicella aquatilis]
MPVQAETPGAPAPLPSRWPDLRKRVLSAALLIPAAVLCIWLGAEAWAALMAAAVALLAWEWVRLCGFSTRHWPGLAVPVLVLAAGTLAVEAIWGAALAVLLLGFAGLWAAGRPAGQPRARPSFWLAFGVLYIGLAGVALIHLRGDAAAGRGNVFFLFLVVWASDIGAYLAGRRFGGPKLAPAISPNKTWSGAAGGLVSAMLVGLAAAALADPAGLPLARVLLVAGLIGVVAQCGDLFESWLKRHYHVKDSSALIPGHGGLLDRLDAVLAAAPVAAVLAALAGPGAALWR